MKQSRRGDRRRPSIVPTGLTPSIAIYPGLASWAKVNRAYGASRQSDDPFRTQECHLRITGASRRYLARDDSLLSCRFFQPPAGRRPLLRIRGITSIRRSNANSCLCNDIGRRGRISRTERGRSYATDCRSSSAVMPGSSRSPRSVSDSDSGSTIVVATFWMSSTVTRSMCSMISSAEYWQPK
jgi:hypothetical protein